MRLGGHCIRVRLGPTLAIAAACLSACDYGSRAAASSTLSPICRSLIEPQELRRSTGKNRELAVRGPVLWTRDVDRRTVRPIQAQGVSLGEQYIARVTGKAQEQVRSNTSNVTFRYGPGVSCRESQTNDDFVRCNPVGCRLSADTSRRSLRLVIDVPASGPQEEVTRVQGLCVSGALLAASGVWGPWFQHDLSDVQTAPGHDPQQGIYYWTLAADSEFVRCASQISNALGVEQ